MAITISYKFISVHCGNPFDQTYHDNSSIKVIGYTDPAVGGTTITLSCLPGLILTGPHTSTCMENGEWEPDPKKVECIGMTIIIIERSYLSMQL